MRLLRSGSAGKKAVVEEFSQFDQCCMSHHMQPSEALQRSIGLFAMRHGEGALKYALLGARGSTSHRVQSTRTPPLILYPSLDALEVSQALQDSMVRLHERRWVTNSGSDVSIFGTQLSVQRVLQARIIRDDGGFNVPGVGTCVVPSSESVFRLQVRSPFRCQQTVCELSVSKAQICLLCVPQLEFLHSCQCHVLCRRRSVTGSFAAKLALCCKIPYGKASFRQHTSSTRATLLLTSSGGKLPRYTSIVAPLSWVSADWQQTCLASAPSLLHTYFKAFSAAGLGREGSCPHQARSYLGQARSRPGQARRGWVGKRSQGLGAKPSTRSFKGG